MALKTWITGCVAVSVAAAALAGCGRVAEPAATTGELRQASFRTASVGKDFLWGVSTAGYQWEGQDTVSQWAAWDKAGKTEERNPRGANGLEMYPEDAKLTAGLGANAFRTSIEWARIEPEEGKIDPAAVAHYHKLLDTLRANGLQPVITLMHFSYPAWLDADGGWENPKVIERFKRHAAFIAKEYGDKIDLYMTYNEPNVFLLGGWAAGMTPPGKKNPIAGLRAMKHMITAHGEAYDAIHANDTQAKVSFNMYTAEFAFGGFGTRNAVTAQEMAAERISSDDAFMEEIMSQKGGGKVDYAALDYYCKFRVKVPFSFPRPDTWEVYPEGLYKQLKKYHRKYKLPVLIAENGMATHDLQPRQDRWTRSAYTIAHIKQIQRAIADGTPVMGYIHWSITDNYEWGSFSPRFGLFSVDSRDGDFRRRKAEGADAFQAIIAAGGVTRALEQRYPPPGLPAPWLGGGTGTPVGIYR